MSRTVDVAWFRHASHVAKRQLTQRRHAELLDAAAAHYAAYPASGDSKLLLFDAGYTLVAYRSFGTLTNTFHTNITKPALSSVDMLNAERDAAERVRQRLLAAAAIVDGAHALAKRAPELTKKPEKPQPVHSHGSKRHERARRRAAA